MFKPKHRQDAFTIVELLIVVVVIAILAAITMVAYRGFSNRAEEAVVKSDLTQAAKQLGMTKALSDTFPSDLTSANLNSSEGVTYEYDSSGQAFCLSAVRGDRAFYVTQDGNPKEGVCSGHSGPTAGGDEGSTPATMQTFTQSSCNSLATYTGSNSSALITLEDPRGTPRTYTIGKLADGKCWMLDNLKLGSASDTITLTPADSSVSSNFTLPQLTTSGSTNADVPTVKGPVTGDTGSGATNYGYLYNWPAATAGESRTSRSAGSGNAPHSICPAGWRLPTGGSSGEFSALNTAMGGGAANWNYAGPLRGVRSGYWIGAFSTQGTWGYLWSSYAHLTSAEYASNARFDSGFIDTANNGSRGIGSGVRCLLK